MRMIATRGPALFCAVGTPATAANRLVRHGAALRRLHGSATCLGAPLGDDTTHRHRVLSGVQPTGDLHLGNYLGALKQWVDIANNPAHETFFCVVDLHAVTVLHDPKQLEEATLQAAATFIAAGVEPARSTIFVQSHVSAHAELAWLLHCITPMSWLERMTQYKDKVASGHDDAQPKANVGLFSYPVLMAADILLYQADLVPVGDDQRQHLELTREIARRFADLFCSSRQKKTKNKTKNKPQQQSGERSSRRQLGVFTEPQGLIVDSGARVMSLQDGTSKMSKSADSDLSRINLLDPPDVVAKKIKKCKSSHV